MIFIKAALAGIASIAAILFIEQLFIIHTREPDVVRCDGGAEDVEAWIDRWEAELTS